MPYHKSIYLDNSRRKLPIAIVAFNIAICVGSDTTSASRFGVKIVDHDKPSDALVTAVIPGSPSQNVRLPGEETRYRVAPRENVIIEINGNPIQSANDMAHQVAASPKTMHFKVHNLSLKRTREYKVVLNNAEPNRTAVSEIRHVLAQNGLDRNAFPANRFDPASFDPKQHEPMYLDFAWRNVQERVTSILSDYLDTDFQPGDFSISFAETRERSGSYTVLFDVVHATAKASLKEALSLPESCFLRRRDELALKTEDVVKYVKESRNSKVTLIGSNVRWEQMGAFLANFANKSKRLDALGFAVQRPTYLDGKKKVQVTTSYVGYGRDSGYRYYLRFLFAAERLEKNWVRLIVRGQVGRVPNGFNIDRIEYLGSEEFSHDFSVPLDGLIVSVQRAVTAERPVIVRRKGRFNKIVDDRKSMNAKDVSTSYGLSKVLIEKLERQVSGRNDIP